MNNILIGYLREQQMLDQGIGGGGGVTYDCSVNAMVTKVTGNEPGLAGGVPGNLELTLESNPCNVQQWELSGTEAPTAKLGDYFCMAVRCNNVGSRPGKVYGQIPGACTTHCQTTILVSPGILSQDECDNLAGDLLDGITAQKLTKSQICVMADKLVQSACPCTILMDILDDPVTNAGCDWVGCTYK